MDRGGATDRGGGIDGGGATDRGAVDRSGSVGRGGSVDHGGGVDRDGGVDREPGAKTSSPWPMVAALGIAATEAGVLFGFAPVAVGGVMAVGGSAAAMAREVGYADDLWQPLRAIGAVVALVSAAVWIAVAPSPTPEALLAATAADGIAVRAAVVCGAAALLIAAGVSGPALAGRR